MTSSPRVTKRPSAAGMHSSVGGTRLSSAPRPSSARYDHPYLAGKQAPPKKELGLWNLFTVKVCRCFVVDDLPPPNPEATLYQADKSCSSTGTGTSATATATSGGAGAAGNVAPVKSIMEGIKYNRPPPEAPKLRRSASTAIPVRNRPFGEFPGRDPRDRASEPLKSSLGDIPGPELFGRVHSLSALFEKPDQ